VAETLREQVIGLKKSESSLHREFQGKSCTILCACGFSCRVGRVEKYSSNAYRFSMLRLVAFTGWNAQHAVSKRLFDP